MNARTAEGRALDRGAVEAAPLPQNLYLMTHCYTPLPAALICASRVTICLLTLSTNTAHPAEPPAPSGPAIQLDAAPLWEMGSVLYVAAHPDDENTQLITYLARGRGYRTAYLSLTRGDGGQNVLGGEFGAQLGVIRTQELLAARRLDGGRQFFTRALDFGFSKDYQRDAAASGTISRCSPTSCASSAPSGPM